MNPLAKTLILLFGVEKGYSNHLFNPHGNNHGNGTNYRCFDPKDTPSVNTNEWFNGKCFDENQNSFKEGQTVTSCCECLVHTCTRLASAFGQEIYYWNTSVSEKCCLGCHGTVFKNGLEMDPVTIGGSCGTVETSVCRYNPDTQTANVDFDFHYTTCCSDATLKPMPLGTQQNDSATCSVRTCYKTESMFQASWTSSKVFDGECNCCDVEGIGMVNPGFQWCKNDQLHECCDGKNVIVLKDGKPVDCSESDEIITVERQVGFIMTSGSTNQETLTSDIYYNGNYCEFPDLNPHRNYHTMTGLIACGGRSNANTAYTSCSNFNISTGEWQPYAKFSESRVHHTAWKNSQGILLMGGYHNVGTTTLVPFDGESKRSFDLKIPAYGQCSVDYSASVILLGGAYAINRTTVYISNATRYNENGYMETLPNMNYRRYASSCAGYYDDNDNFVILAMGGYGGPDNTTTITSLYNMEMLTMGEDSWVTLGIRLSQYYLMAISTPDNNVLLMMYDKIYQFEKTNKTLTQVYKMPYYRIGQNMAGSSFLMDSETMKYCQG